MTDSLARLREMADLLIRHGGNEEGARIGGFLEEVFSALDDREAQLAEMSRQMRMAADHILLLGMDRQHTAVLADVTNAGERMIARAETAERERDEVQAAWTLVLDLVERASERHDHGCSGEFPEFKCKCGLRTWLVEREAALASTPVDLAATVQTRERAIGWAMCHDDVCPRGSICSAHQPLDAMLEAAREAGRAEGHEGASQQLRASADAWPHTSGWHDAIDLLEGRPMRKPLPEQRGPDE